MHRLTVVSQYLPEMIPPYERKTLFERDFNCEAALCLGPDTCVLNSYRFARKKTSNFPKEVRPYVPKLSAQYAHSRSVVWNSIGEVSNL